MLSHKHSTNSNSFSAKQAATAGMLAVAIPSCLDWHLGTGADKRQEPVYASALVGEFVS